MHGGVIALLVLLLAGHVVLRSLLRSATVPVTVAVTAFGGGCVLMTASLVLDGFVTPAHALHYRAAQELMMSTVAPGLLDHALLASLFLVALWHLVLAFGVLQGTYRPESAPRASFDGDPDGTARSSIASLQIMPVCWPGRRPR